MITFNSGRWYTDNGQRIAAESTPEGGILFADVDRNIDGYFRPEVVQQFMLTLTPVSIMWGYDHYDKTEYWIGTHEHNERLKALREAALKVMAPPELRR